MGWMPWALLSALFAALTAILAKKGIAHVEPNLATAIRTTVVVVFAWAIAMVFGRPHELGSIDRKTFGLLALSGMATGLSWICYFRALSLGQASKVAPVDKLSVVFVLLLAWPLLGEQPSLGRIVGAGLITVGAVVLAVLP
ncbi:MAG: EamA family transporter [Terriglobus sp.]